MYMYNYILYLFGFYNQYYDEDKKSDDTIDEVPIIAQNSASNAKIGDKKDMITNYKNVIDELKIKLKARNHLDE